MLPIAFLSLLVALSTTAQAQGTECHILGECTGNLVGLTTEEDYNDCLSACQDGNNCNWFSFNDDYKYCFQYLDCLPIDTTCTACFTGQKECTPEEGVCAAQGFCDGHVMAYDTTPSVGQCVKLCQELDGCLWYSYFSASKACLLMADCPFIDESCSDCLSGEKGCHLEVSEGQLMLVGSALNSATYEVEVVDLTGGGNSCRLANIPQALGSVGAFIGENVTVCGGGANGFSSSKCYIYNPSTDAWIETDSMLSERLYAAGVLLSPTEWWITGGLGGDESGSELYSISQGFSSFVDLPEDKQGHNLVRINDTHYMLLGDDPASNKAWMFDKTSRQFTTLPDLLEGRERTHAGLVTSPNGRQAVVVAGGFLTNTTEIFDLEEQTWTYGPDLPVRTSEGASVQTEDTFLIVGGTGSLRTIYRFDTSVQDWIELEQGPMVGRRVFAAVMLPADFINCNN